MPRSFAHERRVAIEAVTEAARLCRAVQSDILPETFAKTDKSPVTVADFGSQALVCRMLGQAFPNDPIVAEEDSTDMCRPEQSAVLASVTRLVRSIVPDGDAATICRWIDLGGSAVAAERFWTLDPIDGTKGFLRKEQYAIALALVVHGQLEVAALACPNLPSRHDGTGLPGIIFVAVRKQGAYAHALDADHDATEQRINVSDRKESARARFCESVESGHSAQGDSKRLAEVLGISAEPVRMDSQAKYGVVARGQAELYLRLPTSADYREKIWDHAAGALIISEAGGRVTDIDGKLLDFTHGRELAGNRGVVVSNGAMHDSVLRAIASLGI